MEKPKLKYVPEFDPGPHRYFYKNVEQEPLTSFMKKFGMGAHYAEKPQLYENARAEGTNLHLCCRLLAENDLDWDSVDPKILPRVREFESFLRDYQPQVLLTEQPVCDPSIGVACTPDLVAIMKNCQTAVIEIKRGSEEVFHKMQTAGQSQILAANGVFCTMRFALYLPKTNYRLVAHNDIQDLDDFQTLARAWIVRKKYTRKEA